MDDPALRLARVRERIAAAARIARRDPAGVRLVAVTKGRTGDEIAPLIAAGQIDFGESRVQEAEAKWGALRANHPGVRLHCVGRLQSNKAAAALGLFDCIHSLDRLSLLAALAAAVERGGRALPAYVQVNIGAEPNKGGCAIAELGALLAALRLSPLPLAGLMCIPPADARPGPYFALLARLAADHGVAGLSMGMSGDFETAVMLGATVVRVGSALFEG